MNSVCKDHSENLPTLLEMARTEPRPHYRVPSPAPIKWLAKVMKGQPKSYVMVAFPKDIRLPFIVICEGQHADAVRAAIIAEVDK